MTITLRPVTRDNWEAVVRLQVTPEQQGFVASNLFSIAESFYEPGTVPLAIYAEDRLVGLAMYGLIDDTMWIWRLMIDRRHQRKGYARAAMQALIQMLAAMGNEAIYLSYEPDNEGAAALYHSLGFRLTGEKVVGELVARLELARRDEAE